MKPNRIPLVVGVTGHRDLRGEDVPKLQALVHQTLIDLRDRHEATPLVLLSSLAEGADRLVARVALDLGYELIAPLPLPPEIYRHDFATEASRREFEELRARAAASFALPFREGVTEQNVAAETPRARQYALSGEYILRHCHVLLALWDGVDTGKTGGTWEIVRQKLSGFPVSAQAEWTLLKPPDSGTVFHLRTPRQSHPEIDRPCELDRIHIDTRFFHRPDLAEEAERDGARIFESLLARTNTFNRHLARLVPSLPEKASSLAGDPARPPSDPDLEDLREKFAGADALASYFQKRRRLSLVILCVLGVALPFSLAAYHSTGLDEPAFGIACTAAFCAGFFAVLIVYGWTKWEAYETKHLDYRALAEGLKVLLVWRMAGVRDDVGAQYLRKQRSEIDWIRLAVRASDLRTSQRVEPAEPYSWLQRNWMEDQQAYFERRSHACGASEKTCALAATTLVGTGVALVGSILTLQSLHFHDMPETLFHRLHWLSAIIVGLLAGGAAVAAYAEKLAFAQQAKQYKQMQGMFTLAVEECAACLSRGETGPVHTLIRRLGQEALRENGDWVLLHRERPMELRIS